MFLVGSADERVGGRSGEATVFQSLWRRGNRAVMIVSENPMEPLFDSDFLRQPDIRLLTSFPDEGADVHVGLGVPCQHSQQHALSHAAAGEDSDALSLAAGDQAVDGPDAGAQRLGDPAAGEGVGR